MIKGTIALDIDGTITDSSRMIPDEVALYLDALSRDGWRFILVTGRPFTYAMNTLGKLNFPFYLGVQNGADLILMPENKHLKRHYLNSDVIDHLDQLYKGIEEDFLVYSGYEKGDFCYYRPTRFSDSMQGYLEQLKSLSDMPWQELETFADAKQSLFSLVKCFGSKKTCLELEGKLQTHSGIKTCVIKDPINPELYLLLINHAEANKGSAVSYFMDTYALPRPLIAAGDDNNDIPLLRVGDMKIAMEDAPEALQNIAEIIAPAASRSGIIQGLGEAIERLR